MTDLTNREKTLYDLAKQYRASQVRSANENDTRSEIREAVEKLGLDSKSFQDSIRMELELTPSERTDYVNGLQDMQAVLSGRADDLFGEEEMRKKQERIKKREERAAQAASKPESTDDNPRSDPKSGGAGGLDGKAKAKDAAPKKGRGKKGGDNVVPIKSKPSGDPVVDASLADIQARELRDGDELLTGHIDAMRDGAEPVDNSAEEGAPLSQSAKAARAREEAGLPN